MYFKDYYSAVCLKCRLMQMQHVTLNLVRNKDYIIKILIWKKLCSILRTFVFLHEFYFVEYHTSMLFKLQILTYLFSTPSISFSMITFLSQSIFFHSQITYSTQCWDVLQLCDTLNIQCLIYRNVSNSTNMRLNRL